MSEKTGPVLSSRRLLRHLWQAGGSANVRRRFTLIPLLLLTLLILVFFNRMAFTNQILARGDTFLYFYPYWEAAAAALRSGRVPLWNPQLFMGAPLLANSQVGFFYPFNWPFWLLLPAPYAVTGSILLHLLLAGGGTYRLARRALGHSWPAALLAALLFALGGYLTAQVEHVNQLQGLAWLPWMLEIAARSVKMGTRREHWLSVLRHAALLGGFFALQLAAGHTQTVFIAGVALLIWTAGLHLATGNRRRIDLTHHPGDPSQDQLEVSQFARVRGVAEPGLPAPEQRLPKPPRYHEGNPTLPASNGSAAETLLSRLQSAVPILLSLALGIVLALLLSAVQLLPTAELAQQSARAGGLTPNEVLSFSLHPLLVGAALLPAFGQSLFSEYVAFLPLSALLLALVGAWQWRAEGSRRPGLVAALLLAGLGLFLALGRFNLLYLLLARLPGFDLFRAPARWLVLYALGMALLAGSGLDRIRGWRVELGRVGSSGAARRAWGVTSRPVRVGCILILLLVISRFLALPLAELVPVGAEAPVGAPSVQTVVGWMLEGTFLLLLLWWGGRSNSGERRLLLSTALIPLTVLVLFLASRDLPYNRLTAPQAYFSLRPPVARLQALGDCQLLPENCQVPPGRLLGLSRIFFDPGDMAEIQAIYGGQLTPEALYDYLIAVKHKEVLSPNLPLAYDLSSVDGFDGGILPLRAYSLLTGVMLPPGAESVDGRLREYVDAVPEARWLDLFNVRYLITDKVGDEWRAAGEQNTFFDLQHPVRLQPGQDLPVGYLPPYEATGIWLLAEGAPGRLLVDGPGQDTMILTPEALGDDLWRVGFPAPLTLAGLRLHADDTPWTVRGIALVDTRDNTFQPLVPGNYQLVYSGDVKIYENLDVLPRAFVVGDWRWQTDVAAAVAAMADPTFDPAHTAVLVGQGEDGDSGPLRAAVEVGVYRPEQVVIDAELAAGGLLVLTDAHYPGWEATVDGAPAPLYQVDGLFRGVMVPAGAHEVVFTFVSRSYRVGRALTLGALLLLAGLSIWSFWERRGG